MTKPQKLGTVWASRAILFNKQGKKIATCMDTPNAIAKAFMEMPRSAYKVKTIMGTFTKEHYKDRMKPWNAAQSHLTRIK